MVSITVDGKKIEAKEGTSVLRAALDAGIYIPHLCHHPDLKDISACKVCFVQVEGHDEPETSCNLTVEDGMVVVTKNEEIDKLRKLAMELILAAHPEDCSVCPKYGKCELQNLIQYLGVAPSRMRLRAKGFQLEDQNPLYDHEMNRCVLCGRCVRACNELRGVKVLQYNREGLEIKVGALHDKLLKDADCRFCGACAEVCPTGSIRDRLVYTAAEKQDKLVPCRATCPANTDIPRYVRFVKEGKFDEAAAVIREKLTFPECLGHVCSHVCEGECRRQNVNASVSIRNIKRYAAEKDTGSFWRGKEKRLPDTGKKVCVIGAGPAGLTAAYYLRKQGHAVTVKEALPKSGG
ncbi:MAG: 4Fe-4S dicluster domain-containing protein, partial [Lachnospiraceae bacterium]|nr:4Fe-4S dicluster domain-containing protein [Lachnospiraceae bacterium]